MSRLSIEVSSEQHQKIKALAALQGQSIKDYILKKLFNTSQDGEQDAMEELEELLLSRIKHSQTTTSSNKSIQDITDTVIRNNKS